MRSKAIVTDSQMLKFWILSIDPPQLMQPLFIAVVNDLDKHNELTSNSFPESVLDAQLLTYGQQGLLCPIKNHRIMQFLKTVLLFLSLFFIHSVSNAQEITQTIRGTVLDQDSKLPLIGATIKLLNTDPMQGASTDLDGNFKIEAVTIGRHNIEISYLGYEPRYMNSIMVTSGKELVLTIELLESTQELAEVVVSASAQMDKSKPLNEFATVSARTFSVEETSRYAFSAFDPSRMAMNYAGVSVGASDDLSNEIVIRGNSPTGVLWRMEGIEIPNPNHFSSMGSSGGGISMLSSSTLSNSDFYTGAFPSEFGNALSGVFDLKLRNGNNQKREYSFMLGALGIEAAMEGPFGNNSKASYLVNYRYSTLGLLGAIGLNPVGDILPKYQDLSFKINVPTKNAGTFALFGLGGMNVAEFQPTADSTAWEFQDDREGFKEPQTIGTIGLSHRLLLSDKSFLHTAMIAGYENTKEDVYNLLPQKAYEKEIFYRDEIQKLSYRMRSSYNLKINAKHTFQIGAIGSIQEFQFSVNNLNEENNQLEQLFKNDGSTFFGQAFAHWKYRINKSLTLNSGLHYSYLGLNKKMSLEPRAALAWKVAPKHTLSSSFGLHSKMEPLALYLFEGTLPDGTVIEAKKNLGLTKAFHAVLAYDYAISSFWRIKAEAYFQHLYDVPVENIPNSNYSILNAFDVWDLIDIPEAAASGSGRNIGMDLTVEKFFDRQYYFMCSGSIFESTFVAQDKVRHGTRFNGNVQFNVLGGKEFMVGKKKNKTLGLNGKFILSGGNRFTPVDLVASEAAGETVRKTDQPYADRSPAYYRFDLGLSYRINAKSLTHTFMLDFQNVTNRANIYAQFYNADTKKLDAWTQTGFFPNFNYRIEF